MQQHTHFFQRVLLVLALSATLATLSFFFMDRPIAFWMVDHHPIPLDWMKTITQIPKAFEVLALFIFASFLVMRALGKNNGFLSNLVSAGVALVITDFWVEWCKFSFGRYWPRTWYENNPSLIDTNEYGFHFFHSKAEAFQSFPSGHTALTVTVLTAIALAYPRFQVPAVIVALSVPLCLIGLDHHFLADTIAGAGLGWIVAYSVHHARKNVFITG